MLLNQAHAILISICNHLISNGNRTEWSPIRSVIIRVITKSDDRAAGVRFVYHDLFISGSPICLSNTKDLFIKYKRFVYQIQKQNKKKRQKHKSKHTCTHT